MGSEKYYNSTICLLAKNENDYINEWLSWHLNINFDHIYIYDNDSDISIRESIKHEYLDYCTIIDWGNDKYKHDMQIEAYFDCLEKAK